VLIGNETTSTAVFHLTLKDMEGVQVASDTVEVPANSTLVTDELFTGFGYYALHAYVNDSRENSDRIHLATCDGSVHVHLTPTELRVSQVLS
jgi:hypothetical protein